MTTPPITTALDALTLLQSIAGALPTVSNRIATLSETMQSTLKGEMGRLEKIMQASEQPKEYPPHPFLAMAKEKLTGLDGIVFDDHPAKIEEWENEFKNAPHRIKEKEDFNALGAAEKVNLTAMAVLEQIRLILDPSIRAIGADDAPTMKYMGATMLLSTASPLLKTVVEETTAILKETSLLNAVRGGSAPDLILDSKDQGRFQGLAEKFSQLQDVVGQAEAALKPSEKVPDAVAQEAALKYCAAQCRLEMYAGFLNDDEKKAAGQKVASELLPVAALTEDKEKVTAEISERLGFLRYQFDISAKSLMEPEQWKPFQELQGMTVTERMDMITRHMAFDPAYARRKIGVECSMPSYPASISTAQKYANTAPGAAPPPPHMTPDMIVRLVFGGGKTNPGMGIKLAVFAIFITRLPIIPLFAIPYKAAVMAELVDAQR